MLQPESRRACNPQPNRLRARARLQHEVIFQLSLMAVVNQVHTLIDILVTHFGKPPNIRMPLLRIISDEVVALARQLVLP